MEQSNQLFFSLLRTAMTDEPFEPVSSAQEWSELYEMADRQSVMGVCYTALSRLSGEQKPPLDLMMQWMGEAETIRGLNELQNHEAARLTRLFSEQGRKTAILKGQANARLYPDKLSRQVGDIDIWVEGGHESVVALLTKMGLIDGLGKRMAEGKALDSYHHIHIPPTKQGVIVEVHFRPSSGNRNPVTNRRLQEWLEQEIQNTTSVEQGFNVPSVRFALMMQLAHIQRHFLAGGIGLRHICDYYLLLQNSTAEDRREVASRLKAFGLQPIADALMWLLGEVLHLDEAMMLCEGESYRGEWLLREVMEGGNFGRHAGKNRSFFGGRMAILTRGVRMMRFNFWEVILSDLRFWTYIVVSIPERIRRGHWSLVKADERDQLKQGKSEE
jgi:hypothetical protein